MFNFNKIPQGGEQKKDYLEQIKTPGGAKQEQIEKLKEEQRNLNKLQLNGRIDDQEWNREVHFPRLDEIKTELERLEKNGEMLSEKEREELRQLRMKQAGAGSGEWTDGDREKFLKLQERENLE